MRTTKRRTRPRRLAAIAVAGALTATALATSPAQAAEVTVGDRVFDVTSAQAGKSLYQAAWSEEQDAIWVTGTTHHFNLGYPIADESTIQKIDPETLQVEQTITPRTLGAGTDVERPEAAYGVAVDDEHNLVWTSATREDAVVVYDATTGDRVKTIGGVGHSRDIAIDPYRDIAYVSDPNGGSITKISTDTLQVVETIALGGNFSPMSLDLVVDEDTALLYTVNLNDGKLLEFDSVAKDYREVGSTGGNRASGVAVDAERGKAYVASQDSSDVRTVDLATGQVLKTVDAGAAALNVAVDAEAGLVYTAIFGGSSVLVTDADTGEKIGHVNVGVSPNDVILVDGSAIAVDRGATGAQGLSSLWRITPQADGTPDPDPEPEPEPEPATGVTVDGTPAVGGEITLNGVGWKHPDGSGSTIGLKLDDGSVKRASDGTDVWATIEADDDGEFSVTFQLPDGTTEGEHGSTPAFTAGEHTLRFLSGSLKPGDQGRSVAVTIDVAEAGTEPEPEEPTDPDVTEPKPVKKKSKVNTSIKKKIKAKKRGKLKVVVKPGHANEKVVVAIDGKTWKNVKLTRKNAKKAVATVKLPKLKVGKHKVRVVFNGNAVAKKGTAVAKFRVVR